MIGKLICRLTDHKWISKRQFEHICITDQCWRCGKKKVVHLWGPYEHTCEEKKGQLNGTEG